MEVLKYLRGIGFPIIFLLVIFLSDTYSLTIKSGYALVAALFALKGRTITYNMDRDFLVVLAFASTYTMFDYFGDHRGIQYLIIQATFPPAFYALGMIMGDAKLTNKGVVILLVTLGFIYSTSSLLSTLFDIKQGGLAQTTREIPSFWTGEKIKSTGMASYLIYNSVIPAIIVANRKRFSVLWKLVLAAIFAISLIASFRLGSRTLIAISGLSFFVSLLYILSKQSLLDNIKLLGMLVVCAIIAFMTLPFDLDSPIFSTLGHRMQTSRGIESTATAGNRTALWAEGLKNLFNHPLGWNSRMHHHNLWLDVPKVVGIVPLIFLLINNVLCLSSLKKAFFISGKDTGLNVTFLLYFFATFLLFFTEPIMEGNFFSVVVYFLFLGVLNGYIKSRKDSALTVDKKISG